MALFLFFLFPLFFLFTPSLSLAQNLQTLDKNNLALEKNTSRILHRLALKEEKQTHFCFYVKNQSQWYRLNGYAVQNTNELLKGSAWHLSAKLQNALKALALGGCGYALGRGLWLRWKNNFPGEYNALMKIQVERFNNHITVGRGNTQVNVEPSFIKNEHHTVTIHAPQYNFMEQFWLSVGASGKALEGVNKIQNFPLWPICAATLSPLAAFKGQAFWIWIQGLQRRLHTQLFPHAGRALETVELEENLYEAALYHLTHFKGTENGLVCPQDPSQHSWTPS